MTRAQAAESATKWVPIGLTIVASLAALIVFVGRAGVAVGSSANQQASLGDRVTGLEAGQKADHDELKQVHQRVDDLDEDVRQALSLPPRRPR